MDIPGKTSRRPIRILSLDGGGVRGMSSLLILKRIMDEASSKSQSSEKLLLCNEFDLIIGTSTGGIIALMLGRLRMSVDQCIQTYGGFAEEVFRNPKRLRALLGGAMYDEASLESAITRIMEELSMPSDAPLLGEGCKTAVVTALEEDGSHPILLRSYQHSDFAPILCTICQAARATSAALPYLSPVLIGQPGRRYIDGAFSGHCNPASLARREAEKIWPNQPIGCFLSLGTGSPTTIPVRGFLWTIAINVAKLASECHSIHEELDKQYSKSGDSPYFRFSVREALACIRLDDWKEISSKGHGRLAALTDKYMMEDEQITLTQRCLRKLGVAFGEQNHSQDSEIDITMDVPSEGESRVRGASGTSKRAIYVALLYPEVEGFALYQPTSAPLYARVGDVGTVDKGRWIRFFNATDLNEDPGLLLSNPGALSMIGRPHQYYPPIDHSDAFRLKGSASKTPWTIYRFQEAGAVLITNPDTVYEQALLSPGMIIPDYLKRNYFAIRNRFRAGSCYGISLLESMRATTDWAFHVQNQCTSTIPFTDTIKFAPSQRDESSHTNFWGDWTDTIGKIGSTPQGSAEEKSSVVVVRRWKALEKNYPLGSSFDAAGQRGSGDSIDETDGSGAPRSDAPGAAGGHHASSSSSSYFGPSSVNNLSLSHDIQPSSFLPGNTTTVLGTRTKSSGGIYDQIKMQLERDHDPLDELLRYMFCKDSRMRVAIACDQDLVTLLHISEIRDPAMLGQVVEEYTSKLFKIESDAEGSKQVGSLQRLYKGEETYPVPPLDENLLVDVQGIDFEDSDSDVSMEDIESELPGTLPPLLGKVPKFQDMSYPALCPPNVGDIFSEPHTSHYGDVFHAPKNEVELPPAQAHKPYPRDIVFREPHTSHYGDVFHTPENEAELPPAQPHKQNLCNICSKGFIKPSTLIRHRETVHGLSEAIEVIRRQRQWWEAAALIEMMKRKHMKDKALQERLKEAVDVYERMGGDIHGYNALRKYEEDVIAYARGFVQACTCADCGKVFSRKDAVARRHKCKT